MRRETILQNLKARIATITKANGYTWEPKERFEWLVSPLSQKDLPAIIVNDTKDNYSSQASATHTHRLSFEVEIYIASGEDTAKDLRLAIADVLKVVSTEDGTDMGDYLSVAKTEMVLDQEEKTIGQGTIEFVVTYETAKWEM